MSSIKGSFRYIRLAVIMISVISSLATIGVILPKVLGSTMPNSQYSRLTGTWKSKYDLDTFVFEAAAEDSPGTCRGSMEQVDIEAKTIVRHTFTYRITSDNTLELSITDENSTSQSSITYTFACEEDVLTLTADNRTVTLYRVTDSTAG